MEFLQDNIYKLIFTGIAAIVIGIIAKLITDKKKEKSSSSGEKNTNNNSNHINQTFNLYPASTVNSVQLNVDEKLETRKRLTKILFIDDDTKFKVVTILKNAGWNNTKSVKDITSYDSPEVKDADIFFVDIQGVGVKLACKDEGLGLALNLKRKYPKKKVIIYSAESKGEMFHEALKKADTFLSKNAEPYEFQQIVEEYSLELYPD